jgi:uncharacterized protein involved in exopolysaccharide biosynthesis
LLGSAPISEDHALTALDHAYIRTLRKWAWLIVGLPIVAMIAAAAVTAVLPKQYQATTQVVVNPKLLTVAGGEAQSASYDEVLQTYAQMAASGELFSQLIADGVPRTADQLRAEIKVHRHPRA